MVEREREGLSGAFCLSGRCLRKGSRPGEYTLAALCHIDLKAVVCQCCVYFSLQCFSRTFAGSNFSILRASSAHYQRPRLGLSLP